MASRWSMRRRRWREMCVDTVTLDTLAASSSSRCMWCSVQSLGGGSGSMQAAVQGVTVLL